MAGKNFINIYLHQFIGKLCVFYLHKDITKNTEYAIETHPLAIKYYFNDYDDQCYYLGRQSDVVTHIIRRDEIFMIELAKEKKIILSVIK